MYVIAGATGNTGRRVAQTLLARGARVRAWVRSEDKAQDLAAQGAELKVVDMDDPASVRGGLEGGSRAYLLLPPNMTTPDFLGSRAKIAESLTKAAVAVGLEHIVLLSSIGAHQPDGTGPIRTLHDFEGRLRDAKLSTTSVRAAYFAENWAGMLPAVKGDGVLPQMFGDANLAIPMVATRDIADVAAESLERAQAGVIELEGAVRASANDVARELGAKLGKNIHVVDVPFAAQEATFASFGMHPNLAALYRELNEGVANGRVSFEGGAARHVRGPTSVHDVLAAML